MDEEKVKELENDFKNLLESYWYLLETKELTPFPGEKERLEQWAKELMIKYKII